MGMNCKRCGAENVNHDSYCDCKKCGKELTVHNIRAIATQVYCESCYEGLK